MIEERRDYATRPDDIWRCESCGYWEPRLDPSRAVNAVPNCPYCSTGKWWHRSPVRLWEAVRKEPVA